jgi:hypothetical protein
MSVIYGVIPMLADRKDELAAWLRSLDVACPEGTGRYPSIQELRTVLDQLDGYTVRCSTGALGHWYAEVSPADRATSDGADIVVSNFSGNEADPHEFYFVHSSRRVILLIVQRLASLCGPLMVVPDTGDLPVVVTPDLDLEQALLAWKS